MLMSGFYEAWLDYVILRFLQEKMDNRQTTIDMRARLLFVVLCGNLDVEVLLSKILNHEWEFSNYNYSPMSERMMPYDWTG